MRLQHISIVQDFPQPVNKIFNWLGDHNHLGQIFFPFKVARIRDGQEYLNGVGSVRRLTAFPLPPVEETVTVYMPDERIEYTITSSMSPINDHLGVMRFEPHNGGTRLHYTIVFRGVLPGLGPVLKVGLSQGIRRGLKKLARMPL
jgi:hypothetical protein